MGPLTTHRKSTSVPKATVATEVHHTLYAHLNIPTQVPLDTITTLDNPANRAHLFIGQVIRSHRRSDARLLKDLGRRDAPNPEDVRKRDFNSFVAGEVYPRDACHGSIPVSACVSGFRR